MKFAHLSDVHIGGWREEKMKVMSVKAFQIAVERCMQENVDFIVIAGDLFDSALPQIDLIRDTTAQLKRLKDANIPVYLIPGSHDFSPSGKTMIEVIEKAGLCQNVFKFYDGKLHFTEDPKTKVKLTGILGLACGLDTNIYKQIDKDALEKEPGFKIFLFHTLLEELKPKHLAMVASEPLENFPKGFKYYAGGHPHYAHAENYEGYGLIAYPGALFPNNFQELEMFQGGGFYIANEKLEYQHIKIHPKNVVCIFVDVDGKTSLEAQHAILEEARKHSVQDCLVTLRIAGTLSTGSASEINLRMILAELKDAYHVLVNKSKLQSREQAEIHVEPGTVEEIEQKVIQRHLEENPSMLQDERMVQALMDVLNKEKDEGEKVYYFELRVVKDFLKHAQLDGAWM